MRRKRGNRKIENWHFEKLIIIHTQPFLFLLHLLHITLIFSLLWGSKSTCLCSLPLILIFRHRRNVNTPCQLLPFSPPWLCPSAPAIWLSSPAIFYSEDLIIKAKNMFKTMHQHLYYALWSHSPQLFTVHEHESPFPFSLLNCSLSAPLPLVMIKSN